MYLRRHCYDKPWRCPGWAGGGWTYPRVKRCDGGSLDIYRGGRPVWRDMIRFSRCSKCDVRAVPLGTRWVDPTWLRFKFTRFLDDVKDRRERRRR